MEPLDKRLATFLAIPILVAALVFLYLNLFYLPNIPIHLDVDQVTQLFDARRMLDGQAIYRDFFQITPPGTQVVYLLLFKIFGVRAWIPNAMLIVLGLSMMALLILISRKVIGGVAAFLPAVLFLVVPFRSQFDATHHWYSTLAVMAGLAVLMEARTPLRLAGAGALFGLATCFTQARGIPAELGVALFLIWEGRKKEAAHSEFWKSQFHLWWSFFAVLIGFNAYFIWQTGLGQFLNDTIVFGLRFYPSEAWNTYRVYMIDIPRFHPWYRLPGLAIWSSIHLLIPLIYILFFVRYWDNDWEFPWEPWDRLMLLSITGSCIFLGTATAPSWLRICAASPPGVILFAWFWNFPGRFRGLRMKAIWVLALAIALGECAEREIRWHQSLHLPIGRVGMINPVEFDKFQYLLRETKPGDYLFGGDLYDYLLDLRDPARVPYVTGSAYTRPSQVEDVLQGLKTHPVKFVLWSIDLDMPPPGDSGKNNLGPLREYLQQHYHVVKTFRDDSMIWEKNAESQPAAAPLPTTQESNPPAGQNP